jgi:predicted dehydrogenase
LDRFSWTTSAARKSLTPLRIGIAGCGRIVRLAHLQSLRANPRADVVAIADPDPTAKAYVADQAPDAKYFASVDTMLGAAELDAVVIAVPPPAHRAVATTAFARGLHAYVEKPIAASLDDAEAIVAAWRQAGTVAQIGFNCRFNALYRQMKTAIAAGAIGDPIAVRSAWTACWPTQATWRMSPSAGGGALLELASHHVDLLRFLFDTEIRDVVSTTWSNRGDDEAAMLQCTLTNDIHAQMLVCYGTVEEDRFEGRSPCEPREASQHRCAGRRESYRPCPTEWPSGALRDRNRLLPSRCPLSSRVRKTDAQRRPHSTTVSQRSR